MPVFTIATPDGRKVKIRAADQAAAVNGAKEWASENPKVGSGLTAEIAGGMATLNRSLPFVQDIGDNVSAWVATAGDLATGKAKLDSAPGKTVFDSEAYQRNLRKARGTSNALSRDFGERRPIAYNTVAGLGLAAQAAPAFFTGGASATPAVARTGARGLLGSSARIAKGLADSAVVSGLSAQATGYGTAGTMAERQRAANAATLPAMAVGAAIPGGVAAMGAGRRLAAGALRSTGRTGARLANRATGGQLLNPNAEAMRRLAEAMEADRLGPEEVRAGLAAWQRSGASDPALIDLAGENTRALLRSAGNKAGPSRNIAVGYANQVVGDLQDNVVDRTLRLMPDERTADEFAANLKETQGKLATEQYRGPYQTRVAIPDELAVELRDEPGQAALAAARADALERRDMAAVAEIDDFLARAKPAPGVTKLPDVEAPAAPLPVEDPRGSSLLTFLRQQGGLRDDGGDLAARDLGRDRGRFQKDHVINPNGIDVEEAARRAWEAGYFPDAKLPGGADVPDNYVPVDRETLLNAIDREVRGIPPNNDWMQEDDVAASMRWMDDAEDTLPPIDENYWAAMDEGPARPQLSGATLDRTRIALGERGNKFAMRGNNARAGGSFGRRETIDSTLDNVPELKEARGVYYGLQAQRDAVPIGQKALITPADRYAAQLAAKAEIAPEARRAAGMGYRQAIVDAVGNPTEGATGTLNRLATSRNQRENLAATFGPEEAAGYQDAIAREIARVRNARFISPNEGSKTSNVLIDEQQLKGIPTSKMAILMSVLDKLRRGVSMTEAEREAMLSIATRQIPKGSAGPSIPLRDGTRRLLSPSQRARLARGAAAAAGAGKAREASAR